MRTLREVINFCIKKDNRPTDIKIMDIPHYYNFAEALELFFEIYGTTTGYKLTKSEISVICTTKQGYKIAKKKGFRVSYIYDNIDFTDTRYYVRREFPRVFCTILESCDSISGDLLKTIKESLPPNGSILYVFFDSNIPRRYNGNDDTYLIANSTPYGVTTLFKNKTWHSNAVTAFLNKFRAPKMTIEEIVNYRAIFGNKVNFHHTPILKVENLDLTKPIITPHITIVKDLNISIREFLGIKDLEDEYKPIVNEWLVTHSPAAANIVEGEEVILPIGYRFKVKNVRHSDMVGYNYYFVDFDYEDVEGKIHPAFIKISRTYIEYLMTGRTTLKHEPGAFLVFFGYVVGSFYSLDNRFDKVQIIYDYTLSGDKRDLYTCLLPVVEEAKVFYTIKERMKFD